jgi:phosphoribosylanthranilate isomerase
VETIVEIAETVKPHFLQLHGDETLEEIGAFVKSWRERH